MDYNYELWPDRPTKPDVDLLATFLQSWLFYGLIFTVAQKNHVVILQYGDLNTGDSWTTTHSLSGALKGWQEWECSNPSGRVLRMVRIEKVLDIARRTIKRMFSFKGDSQDQHIPQKDLFYVSDQCTLALMTLGETLSAAKSRIMQITEFDVRGWHYDHNEGWGEPRWVIQKIEYGKSCPRTMHMWRSQLQSNATLLLAAYFAYKYVELIKGSEHIQRGRAAPNIKERPPCITDNCYIVSAEDESGQYNSKHDCECRGTCGAPIGPDIASITRRLEGNRIPLLMFATDSEEDVRLVDTSWTLETPKFATISYVWSDGFGNERENKLHICQLQLIRRQLARLGEWNTPFW